jgi:hypothetical protein
MTRARMQRYAPAAVARQRSTAARSSKKKGWSKHKAAQKALASSFSLSPRAADSLADREACYCYSTAAKQINLAGTSNGTVFGQRLSSSRILGSTPSKKNQARRRSSRTDGWRKGADPGLTARPAGSETQACWAFCVVVRDTSAGSWAFCVVVGAIKAGSWAFCVVVRDTSAGSWAFCVVVGGQFGR